MTTQPRDRDILLFCGAAIVVGLALIAVGAALEGARIFRRLA
jgi:hypothetical protein